MPLHRSHAPGIIRAGGAFDVERFDYEQVQALNGNTYTNRSDYLEVEFRLTVTPPTGSPFTVFGFWAGGTTWQARIRGDQVGTYSYTSSWFGTGAGGTHAGAETPSGNFTVGDTGIYTGPLQVASDKSWFFQTPRGQFHARGYGLHHLYEGWASTPSYIDYLPMVLSRITTHVTAKGHNLVMMSGLGAHTLTSSWWHEGGTAANRDVFEPAVWTAWDNTMLHLRASNVHVMFFLTLFYQISEPSTDALKQRTARYFMARNAAFFNVFGIGPTYEWYDILTSTEMNTLMNFVKASDPYGRLLACHDASPDAFSAWQGFSITQREIANVNPKTLRGMFGRRMNEDGAEINIDEGGATTSGVGDLFAELPILFSEHAWMTDSTWVAGHPTAATRDMPVTAEQMRRNIWATLLGGAIPMPDWWNLFQTPTGSPPLPTNLDVGEDQVRIAYNYLYANTRYRYYTAASSLITSSATEKICARELAVEYLAYTYGNATVTINLAEADAANTFTGQWLNPATGATQVTSPTTVAGGASRSFTSPFGTADSVLRLHGGSGIPATSAITFGTTQSLIRNVQYESTFTFTGLTGLTGAGKLLAIFARNIPFGQRTTSLATAPTITLGGNALTIIPGAQFTYNGGDDRYRTTQTTFAWIDNPVNGDLVFTTNTSQFRVLMATLIPINGAAVGAGAFGTPVASFNLSTVAALANALATTVATTSWRISAFGVRHTAGTPFTHTDGTLSKIRETNATGAGGDDLSIVVSRAQNGATGTYQMGGTWAATGTGYSGGISVELKV